MLDGIKDFVIVISSNNYIYLDYTFKHNISHHRESKIGNKPHTNWQISQVEHSINGKI